MGRLFTFGCSFTSYMWPTWANIVAYDQEAEHYNLALPGLGNVGIHHRIIEADIKYKFQPEDKIMILWTSFSREDRFIDGRWQAEGSVFNAGCRYDNRSWLKNHWSMQNDLVKNMTAIITVNKLYKDNIIWQGHSFTPYNNEAALIYDESEHYNLLKDFYSKEIPHIDWHMFETNKPFGTLQDSHPDILGHLQKVRDWIYPSLGLELRSKTEDRFTLMQHFIVDFVLENKIKEDLDKVYDFIHRNLYLRDDFQDIKKYSRNIYVFEDMEFS